MEASIRPEIPKDQLIEVNNIHKIDFEKPFKFIYMDWWYEIAVQIPFLIAYIMVIFCALFFGFRVKGRKNLKVLKKQGCITISNHCHYFDTVLANYVVLPRALHTAVAQRNFEVPYVRRILRILRAFPIPANGRGLQMISEPVGEALKKKHHIHFLPEGDLIMYSQTIYRFKPGAFILACRHQAPVVPMVYRIRRRRLFGREMPLPWIKMTMEVGEPIYPDRIPGGEEIPAENINAMAEKAASFMEKAIADYHAGVSK